MRIVLLYHKFHEKRGPKYDKYSISLKVFEKHLKFLKDKKFQFVNLRDLPNFKKGKVVCLTFDDGDITQYKAFELMKKYKVKGTFFIITKNVGRKGFLSESNLREMEESGMEIGSHTVTHRDLTKLNKRELRYELIESKKRLESILKTKIFSISFPGGSYNQEIIKECKKCGYRTIRTSDIHSISWEKSIYPAIPISNNPFLSESRLLLSEKYLKLLGCLKEFSKIGCMKKGERLFIKGIFHVHTNYSYDGKITLKELRNWCIKNNIRIVFLAEHAESFNKKMWKMYVEECERLSNKKIILVPGIEIPCKDDHIILIDPKKFFFSRLSKNVIRFAKKENVLTILAHVSEKTSEPRDVDLVELWNRKYHGNTLLLSNLVWFKRAIKSKPFYAIGGNDIHKFRDLKNVIYLAFEKRFFDKEEDVKKLKRKVIALLKNGKFYSYNKRAVLTAGGNVEGIKAWVACNTIFRSIIKPFGKRFIKPFLLLRSYF
ncbi:MAG: hypothetical protein DRM99_05745 [Thermoplasmata archaeon]|nr:MAG: hypothetical protein DRM99_05745 [Thermoplasmata archaeon]